MGQQYGRDHGRGGRGPAWQRDEKGRKFYEEAGERVYENQADRDAALEEQYKARPCERECCPSILAAVSAHRDDLVRQFMSWAERRGAAEVHDGGLLAEWEEGRFGARLYPAAHGVLLYGVRVARFGERQPRKPQPRVIPGLTDEERKARMDVALHHVAEGKTMPDRIGGREWDARRRAILDSGKTGGAA